MSWSISTRNKYSRRGWAKKVKSGGAEITTCWARIYDVFAARYGIKDPQEFYEGYTLRQVNHLLRIIDKARYDELATQAKLHGVKIKPRIESLDLTEEEREEATAQAQSVFDRMKAEHNKKQEADKNDW